MALADLTQLEILQGSLGLIWVLIAIFIGLKAISRAIAINRTRDLITVGLSYIFVSSAWFGVAFQFISYGFFDVKLDSKGEAPLIEMMMTMYFLQVFVALISYDLGINFVTQDMVQLYKKRTSELKDTIIPEAEKISVLKLIEMIKGNINSKTEFVEVVVYGSMEKSKIDELTQMIQNTWVCSSPPSWLTTWGIPNPIPRMSRATMAVAWRRFGVDQKNLDLT